MPININDKNFVPQKTIYIRTEIDGLADWSFKPSKNDGKKLVNGRAYEVYTKDVVHDEFSWKLQKGIRAVIITFTLFSLGIRLSFKKIRLLWKQAVKGLETRKIRVERCDNRINRTKTCIIQQISEPSLEKTKEEAHLSSPDKKLSPKENSKKSSVAQEPEKSDEKVQASKGSENQSELLDKFSFPNFKKENEEDLEVLQNIIIDLNDNLKQVNLDKFNKFIPLFQKNIKIYLDSPHFVSYFILSSWLEDGNMEELEFKEFIPFLHFCVMKGYVYGFTNHVLNYGNVKVHEGVYFYTCEEKVKSDGQTRVLYTKALLLSSKRGLDLYH